MTLPVHPDPTRGQHNIPTVATALEALASLVEHHGGHTDAAALQTIRDALKVAEPIGKGERPEEMWH